MKRPYFNREQRWMIELHKHPINPIKTLAASFLLLELAWKKLLREFHITWNRKRIISLFSDKPVQIKKYSAWYWYKGEKKSLEQLFEAYYHKNNSEFRK